MLLFRKYFGHSQIITSQEDGLHQVEMDSQEIHTTNINPSYESSISHPMLK
jgi:hypothetical protein